MKVYELKIGNLYINEYSSDIMMLVSCESIYNIRGMREFNTCEKVYKFLVGKKFMRFQWSQFQTIPIPIKELI